LPRVLRKRFVSSALHFPPRNSTFDKVVRVIKFFEVSARLLPSIGLRAIARSSAERAFAPSSRRASRSQENKTRPQELVSLRTICWASVSASVRRPRSMKHDSEIGCRSAELSWDRVRGPLIVVRRLLPSPLDRARCEVVGVTKLRHRPAVLRRAAQVCGKARRSTSYS